MSLSTLVRSSSAASPPARAAHMRPPQRRNGNAKQRIDPARIETVEEQLLAASLDHHPHSRAALDHLAGDVAALSAEMERARREPLLLRSTASLNRMEELLLEAVVRTHPNRGQALDRLLDDIAGDGVIEPVPMAVIDPNFVDTDFDGMG